MRQPLRAVDPLSQLANLQADVVTREQLATLGLGRDQVRAQVAARRWRQVGRRVVVLHNGPLTRRQRRWVAVLHHGEAALAGITAAEVHGLVGFGADEVHVVVAHQSASERLPGVIVHESRRFDRTGDCQPDSLPPRTTCERSIIDAASWSRHPRRAIAILAAAVQQRLTTAARLRAELLAAGRIRHRRVMLEILTDVSEGAHSLGEVDLARLCRKHRLPKPTRQVRRPDSTGRIRYLDAVWELPDGRVVVVEIDGAGHLEFLAWWDDTHRDNEVALTGDVVLRFPRLALVHDDDRVADQLRRALAPAL